MCNDVPSLIKPTVIFTHTHTQAHTKLHAHTHGHIHTPFASLLMQFLLIVISINLRTPGLVNQYVPIYTGQSWFEVFALE